MLYSDQLTLHTGLTNLLEKSGVIDKYPDVAFFSSYYPGIKDVLGFGIGPLLRFRLYSPHTPVLFFSFHSKNRLSDKDEFGVLNLPGNEFIQLPCSKETIIQAAEKYNNHALMIKPAVWKTFSEGACKMLIKNILSLMKHHGRLQFVNQVGLGLRLATEDIINYPDKRDRTIPIFEKSYSKMQDYFSVPEFDELFALCNLVGDSEDDFLGFVKRLSDDILFLKDLKNKEEYRKLLEKIISIQNAIDEI